LGPVQNGILMGDRVLIQMIRETLLNGLFEVQYQSQSSDIVDKRTGIIDLLSGLADEGAVKANAPTDEDRGIQRLMGSVFNC
jgi:hypothetical protein